MSDKCPKCGSETVTIVNWQSGSPTFDFACGTEQLPGGLHRSEECYKAEIARRDEVIRKAVELFKNLWMDIDFAKEAIEPGLVELGTLLLNLKQIEAFLTTPEVVKVVEEKP